MSNAPWTLNDRCELQWRCWDTEKYIIFNSGSAKTHQLNQFAVDVLNLLKYQSLNFSELAKQLSELYQDIEFDFEIAAYLQKTLVSLDDLGLIEPEST